MATYNSQGQEVVAYKAKAYMSTLDNLVIDGREAEVTGREARRWSPDSFLFENGKVSLIDDYHRKGSGAMSAASSG